VSVKRKRKGAAVTFKVKNWFETVIMGHEFITNDIRSNMAIYTDTVFLQVSL
jgi:hypothetical protein